MKLISKEDLLILLPLIDDRDAFDLDDLTTILHRFGDDYFIEGGQLVKTKESEEMVRIRKEIANGT